VRIRLLEIGEAVKARILQFTVDHDLPALEQAVHDLADHLADHVGDG